MHIDMNVWVQCTPTLYQENLHLVEGLFQNKFFLASGLGRLVLSVLILGRGLSQACSATADLFSIPLLQASQLLL